MSRSFWRSLAVAGFLVSGVAEAQFANRSVGFSGGFISLNEPVISWALPVGLVGTYYMEDGLELTARVHGLIVTLRTTGQQAFAASGGLGIRYLFLQEQFRPYVGLEISYFQAFLQNGSLNYAGASPAAGFEVMLGPQMSVGPRGQMTFYWMLNRSLVLGYELTLDFAAYF